MKNFQDRVREQSAARKRRMQELKRLGYTLEEIGRRHAVSKARVWQILNPKVPQ